MKYKNAGLVISSFARQVSLAVFAALCLSVVMNAQTTLFSLQATLPNDVTPATDVYQMEFKLFDAPMGGTQIGATNAVGAVDVKNRDFTVWLDYGAAAFPGADRFIEISYRRNSSQPFTTLTPRERILSVPYAIRALTAVTADNALNLNGVPAGNFVQTTDPRLSDDRNPLPGSDHYIQNRTSQQQSSNFNISGTGTASVLNAATQYNLGGQRILDGTGGNLGNLTVGLGAGSLTTGLANTFVGSGAGMNNAGGSQNAFVGNGAGRDNTNGRLNIFVGNAAGQRNTSGLQNAFIGAFAGSSNTTGTDNVFFGHFAGATNAAGEGNSFLGAGAGDSHAAGDFNTFVGSGSGANTTSGSNNTLLGHNTTIGANVSNSTGIGANVTVTRSNSVIVGTSAQAAHISGGIASTFSSNGVAGLIASNLVFRRLGLDIAASSSPLCFRIVAVGNQAGELDGGNGLTSCISSSASVGEKTDVKPFTSGMDIIRHLKPVDFRWKSDGKGDIGLNAEDVAEVGPTLVRRNNKGDVNDVKEGGLNALFINAFKEQQAQIEAQETTIRTQREQIKNLEHQIDAIRQLACRTNAQAEACR